MNISEKVAYLKGLAEGMDLNKTSNEGKLLTAMLEVLEDIADGIDNLEFDLDVLSDEVSELDDEILGILEEDSCCCDHYHNDDDDMYDDEYEGDIYEVDCPKCGAEMLVDEEALDEGEIDCDNCGELLEIDFSGIVEDSEPNEE